MTYIFEKVKAPGELFSASRTALKLLQLQQAPPEEALVKPIAIAGSEQTQTN